MTKEWTEQSTEVAVECVRVREVHVRQAEEGGHRDEGGNQGKFFSSRISKEQEIFSVGNMVSSFMPVSCFLSNEIAVQIVLAKQLLMDTNATHGSRRGESVACWRRCDIVVVASSDKEIHSGAQKSRPSPSRGGHKVQTGDRARAMKSLGNCIPLPPLR